MAGKRLLDAAKLLSAGQAVIKQHIIIRQQQWDLYTKTSGLAKGIKAQTDRVTLTASAAYELGKRLNESGPVWQQGQEPSRDEQAAQAASPASAPSSEVTATETEAAKPTTEFRPDATSSSSAIPHDDLGDDGTLSSLRRRELQRQAEWQIPNQTADTQSSLEGSAGRDTFNERSGHVASELSSLPRTKLPKNYEGAATEDIPRHGIDQDVYPSPEDDSVGKTPETTESLENLNTDVFVNPRISRMLGGTRDAQSENPYATRERLPPKPLPEMVAAAERWAKEREPETPRTTSTPAPEESATEKVEPSPTAPAASTTDKAEQDRDTEDLAASIKADVSKPTEPTEQTNSSPAPYEMRESRVPSSRFGRIWQYSGLATSMAFGAVGEGFRRITGGGGEGSLMLSEGNLNRLVAKLSRMRGAALKLGQMISFQDSKVLPPTINAVLQRVQDSADYMPASQRDQVLVRNLGQDWRDLFSSFEEKPFAAASIGQVHKATLASNGTEVAVKVQYPGVKNSIDSDLTNLSLLLTASQLLPKGLFLDRTIANARTELGWECDYKREADAQIRFKDELLHDETDTFAVPTVYPEASGADVLTAEFMHGTGVTKIPDLTQTERDRIGTQILRLCLRELMEWRFMQTDPNWTNFLYNRDTCRIELLDFGASRAFPAEFVEPYVALLIGAARSDRDVCLARSLDLGYLTGRESPAMLDAHVDSILTLAEPFRTNDSPSAQKRPASSSSDGDGDGEDLYDFADQTITDRVRANIGLMLRERLAPPPEETYSLHRKLSGAFLLCARLRSRVPARALFASAVEVWEGRDRKVQV